MLPLLSSQHLRALKPMLDIESFLAGAVHKGLEISHIPRPRF